ncbi:FecR family protein [Ekhidna lutea]|uniref:FecR family protein n=1 Tax=Ekhidna lutea TaxID=447679 RepID=A0A239GRJ1_EKHLU|nr:FecR domain-containing protein [Ekhidna lutea]SNS71398.1 FecR family protein [Ekhidna lutea]
MEEVLAKYFSGEATNNEISLVETWRSESKTNAQAFFDAKNVWLVSQPETAPPSQVLDEIINETQGKVVPFMMRSWVKYASAAVLVLAISLLFVLNNSETDNVYSTQSMADGSEISLHGSSSIEVIAFNDEIREIKVTGKAYFDIERDETRPFIIHTENARVQVLGTSFLVKANGEETEVCVESGLVGFSKKVDGSEVSVKLTKGEMGLISNSNKGIIKRNIRDLNYLAWKTKVITFNESTMAEVEQVLEDVYGIDVSFDNPEFKGCKLTAKFNKKKPKDAIEIIARTFGVEYEFTNGKAILKGKGC